MAVIVLTIAVVILWFLFTGPLAALRGNTSTTGPGNVTINVNVTPATPASPQPGGSARGSGLPCAAPS